MKKILIIQLSLLIALSTFSKSKTTEAKTNNQRNKNIVWISKQINAYGQASNLFYLGKFGAYWSCHKIDVKSDSVKITAFYIRRSSDTLSARPEIIRYDNILSVQSDDKPIPVINISTYSGKNFRLILDIVKHPEIKKQLIEAFNRLIEENKFRNEMKNGTLN